MQFPKLNIATWSAVALMGASAMVLAGCAEDHPHYHERVVYVVPPPPPARPVVVVEADDAPVETEVVEGPTVEVVEFHDRLSPYGHWMDTPEYGAVWIPNDRPDGWRPYSVGHWVHSNGYGWAWVSEEEYGWATYHYGRWALLDGRGWVWIPGRAWAPAWVAWRSGGGYCGWAPLGPERGSEMTVTVVEVDAIPADRFMFCEERYMGERRVRDHFMPYERNVIIIRGTNNITHIAFENGHMVNRGVVVRDYERASGRHVENLEVHREATLAAVQAHHEERVQRQERADAVHAGHVAEKDKRADERVAGHEAHVAAEDAAKENRVAERDTAKEQREASEKVKADAEASAKAQRVSARDAEVQQRTDARQATKDQQHADQQAKATAAAAAKKAKNQKKPAQHQGDQPQNPEQPQPH